jgi:hypothetical protein
MRFHLTKHAVEKIELIRRYGFLINQSIVKNAISKAKKVEDRIDGTHIATILLNGSHVLRVVYRVENDIIIIITLYPGRRKAYGI